MVENCLYIGIDESNHGRYPEIFTSVFSNHKSDSIKKVIGSQQIPGFQKIRSDHRGLFTRLRGRDYSFLVAMKDDYAKYQNSEFIGVVCASLFSENINKNIDHIKIFIDGEINKKKCDFATGIISEIYGLSKSQIGLMYGKQFDRKYHIVNLADELAHYLFRKKTLEELAENPRLRSILDI